MTLQTFQLEPVPGALPEDVAAFLVDATARIDEYCGKQSYLRRTGFFPSDYELGYRTLDALLRLDTDARQLGEWGSGFGVVAGLGALLGYRAHGIEIDPELVEISRRLLADHDLDVEILEGNFIPDSFSKTEDWDVETATVLSGAEAYGDMDLEIEDFDVIFAYPWPTEEEHYCDLFEHFADYGAVLLTFSKTEGMRAYRKVGAVR